MDANPAMEAGILAAHPMHRMGDPEEDIGGAALFLASDDSRYVTGNLSSSAEAPWCKVIPSPWNGK